MYLNGDRIVGDNEYIDALSPAELAEFKYAPKTSVELERYFSTY